MKQFIVILGLTAVVWIGVAMSETVEYQATVRIDMTGYDTVRYAMVYADTTAVVSIASTRLHQMLLGNTPLHATVNMEGQGNTRSIAATRVTESLRASIGYAQSISTDKDSLRIVLEERKSRRYRPLLTDVDITFADQYGLYGQPVVEPQEVTLYGSSESLEKIEEVRVAPARLHNIAQSGNYTLPLDQSWRMIGDVYASCSEVTVYVPVEAYVEKEYTVPINVVGADSSVHLRLYPTEVTLKVWVAQRDLQRGTDYKVEVDYAEVLSGETKLHPRLREFPDHVRPRNIEPDEIEYVVIQ